MIVGPGQKIEGETKGAFKVRWGTFTITQDKKGNLKMSSPIEYKLDPKAGHDAKPPKQWQLTKDDTSKPADKDRQKKELERTKAERMRRVREKEEADK